MTAADFRRIALSFEGAAEGARMGVADFRVGGRVFATLASVEEGSGDLMLSPAIRPSSSARRSLRAGGRRLGRMGVTHIRLAPATRDELTGALRTAWKLRVEKNAASSRKGRRPTTR